MDNENNPDGQLNKPNSRATSAISKPLDASPAQPDTRDELKQIEKAMSGFEKSTLRWSRVAVVMSSLAALFVCAQWWEMHTSSVDTHDLAIAAKNQADRIKDVADAAKAQSEQAKAQTDKMKESIAKTDNLIRATSDLAKESKRYADDADSSLALARQNFTLDQRPYIWFETTGPVIESGKKIAWGLRFRNYGRSPAVQVRSCVLLFWGLAPLEDLSSQVITDKCAHLVGLKPTVIIPPGADVYSTALSGVPIEEDLASMLKGRDFALIMIGRSTYRDNAGNNYSSTTCMGRVATGAVMACDKFIEIK